MFFKKIIKSTFIVIPNIGLYSVESPVSNHSKWEDLVVTYAGLLIFHVIAEPRNSGKSAKSCKIHKNMSVQHI